MNLHRKIRLGLAAKLALCVIASTAAFFTLFGFVNLRVERAQSREFVLQAADRITDVILRSTHYEMLHNDRDALYNVVQALGSEPGIRRIRIFNKEGRITVSTDPRELNTVVDKTAEQCYACHAQSAPLEKLNRRDRARDFHDKQGEHLLGVMRPIENAPECSSSVCHVHDAGQRVLGVIDADLTMVMADEQIARNQATLKWFLLGAILLGSVAAVLFMWLVVYRPVKELIDGTHRVAGGDLEYRLPVRSDDELGDLSRSFNRMTAEVAGIQAKIEEQVRRKTAELERVHKTLLSSEKMASIGKLAATVAHEINNPLFAILTYARLVLRELLKHDVPGRDALAEQLQTIEHESKRCGELVKNLLTFSRQAPSRREPNDLNVVVHRAVLLVKHKLEIQNIEQTETLAEGLPQVDCDANQIQQVILVLMVNASEAMPKGGRLEVSTEFDDAGEQGVVRIKDSGSGIPADVLPRIFDPFFTTKEDQNRTGLGLAVAHSIVEQHAGEISVRSTPGEGTEFRVSLPAVGQAIGLSAVLTGESNGNCVVEEPLTLNKTKGRILIVDDELVVRDSLSKWFTSEGYTARPAGSGREALEIVAQAEFDIALLDIKMPGMDGMELQSRLREADPDLTVVIMTGYAAVDTAVQALKRGAYDYITKPVDPDELSHLVSNALEHKRARREVTRLRENLQEAVPGTELIGKSPAMKKVVELIEMVAPTEATVLITGESGTGKEVVARSIHAAGPRRYMPMVTIHCGALTETLLESELFGHEKGAFTGAQYRKKGKFEVADGGTVFLDEISDISLRTQTDLLRVLQEKEIVRVGGNQQIKVDFRAIAATNKNLETLVKEGAFRPDLYYRLHVFCIELPPLRDRREDIPLLVNHFLNKFCMATSRAVPQISADSLELLMRHDWPGNVRELENAVERALVVGRGQEIRPADFSFQFQADEPKGGKTLDDVERVHIERILRETQHNLSRAARILDIDRTTLYNKLRRYGLR